MSDRLVDERYRVLRFLGSGAIATVFLAEDMALRREVVLKVVDSQYADAVDRLQLLQREARALASVDSPHVVRLYSYGPYKSSFYFAMERVAGLSLEDLLEKASAENRPLAVDHVVKIVAAVAAGLSAAHAKGIVHRDVKPANVMIEADTGRAVLVDFGIARVTALTAGMPSAMAPEQIRNEPYVGPPADIYALGCMAFELLTGRTVFEHHVDASGVMNAHLGERPPVASAFRAELVAFDPVLERALAKDPNGRFETAAALSAAMMEAARTLAFRSARRPRAATMSCVLVLASDPELRRSLVRETMRALEGAESSIELAFATDVDEAQRAFAAQPADVVVIDDESALGMGAQLISVLRRMPHGPSAMMLLVTPDVATRVEALSRLDAHCLSKPLRGRALRSALKGSAPRATPEADLPLPRRLTARR